MPLLVEQIPSGIDPERIKRFNREETQIFEQMADDLGITVEQLGVIARKMLMDVITNRQLLDFVKGT